MSQQPISCVLLFSFYRWELSEVRPTPKCTWVTWFAHVTWLTDSGAGIQTCAFSNRHSTLIQEHKERTLKLSDINSLESLCIHLQMFIYLLLSSKEKPIPESSLNCPQFLSIPISPHFSFYRQLSNLSVSSSSRFQPLGKTYLLVLPFNRPYIIPPPPQLSTSNTSAVFLSNPHNAPFPLCSFTLIWNVLFSTCRHWIYV